MMKQHEFTLVLTDDPYEDGADRLHSIFTDGTILTSAGIPQVRFHRQAPSLEEPIRSAIADISSAGFRPPAWRWNRTPSRRLPEIRDDKPGRFLFIECRAPLPGRLFPAASSNS